jgi:hypothetical protein
MQLIHQLLVYLHIAAGIVALIVFWIPSLARKGSILHKSAGRWFARIMYVTGLSGVVLSSLDLLWPTRFHSGFLLDAVRDRAIFLLSLSLLVLTCTRHGWLTINHHDNRQPLKHPLQILLVAALMAAGILLLARGLLQGNVIYSVFGILQMALSTGMWHYTFKQKTQPREWWTEHLGGMIAAGIGAYTAFFVVGAASMLGPLFNQQPWIAVLVWVGPGVIGGVVIAMLTRHYRRKFAAR